MEVIFSPSKPTAVKAAPNPNTKIVGVIVPAGARVEADDEAIPAGRLPIVSVKDADNDPEVRETALLPERSTVGVHDQLPEESAVFETVCVPTVPETEAPAVVIPENVGRADVTQNWVAPCTKAAPPIWVIKPEEAKTSGVAQTIEKTDAKRKMATWPNRLTIGRISTLI